MPGKAAVRGRAREGWQKGCSARGRNAPGGAGGGLGFCGAKRLFCRRRGFFAHQRPGGQHRIFAARAKMRTACGPCAGRHRADCCEGARNAVERRSHRQGKAAKRCRAGAPAAPLKLEIHAAGIGHVPLCRRF